jgi:glycosyltransferase involved in cell wall biosynthesis
LRIGIDLTAILPVATGVDMYLEELVLALGRVDRDNRYTLFVNHEDRALFRDRLPSGFRVAPRCLRPRPVRLLFQQVGLPALALASGLDVVHSPSFIMPLARGRQRHLLTVYDMTFFSLPECHEPLRRSRLYRWAILASLRRAHLVSVPSEATRRAVLRFLPGAAHGRVRVVPPGIDRAFAPSSDEEVARVRHRFRLDAPYVLYLGTLEPRKNLVRLVEAFARLAGGGRPEDLVLAGRPGWGLEPLDAAIASSGAAHRIRRLGYVDREDLAPLLTAAEVLVYPSLEEGFGFPPLEAMACGTPVVAAESSSLAENLAGAAELVPPEDVAALAAAVERLLVNRELHDRRRRQGLERAARFTWERTAEETVECYRALVRPADALTP